MTNPRTVHPAPETRSEASPVSAPTAIIGAASAEVTVIVVSYNTRELTLSALRTLYATTRRTALHTIVFDNASCDGSADAIAVAFPQVELIRSPDNIGFAAANNRAADRAQTDWLLLLNPDTEVHAGAIDNLTDFARARPEAGIYGGRTVFPDGSLNRASCWRRITLWSTLCSAVGLTALFPRSALFNPEAYPGWARDSVREVDIVQGCFFLIRRALWRELGGFDLRYFMYGEEADLCLRAKALGWRPTITPDAEIMHIMGAASRSRAGKVIQLARSRMTLMHEHWPRWQRPLGAALMWIWAALRMTAARALVHVQGERGVVRAALWSEVWAARGDWLKGYPRQDGAT